MINYYKTIDGKITRINNYEKNCWIRCVAPTEDEISYLISNYKIQPEFVRSSLDEEESSHIDHEEDTTLIVIDSPIVNRSGKNLTYYTNPLSMILTPDNLITISVKENSVMEEFAEGLLKHSYTQQQHHLALQIMLRMAGKYLKYLNRANLLPQKYTFIPIIHIFEIR